jgi:hypothetical protein
MRLASKASLTPLLVQWVGKRCCLLPESITTRRMQCKLQLHGRLFPCAVSMHLHPKEGRKHVQGREVWQVQPKFLMSFPSDPSNVYEVRLSGSIAHLSSMVLGPCFVAPKVLREEAASAEIVPRKWPKVPFL